MMGGLSKGVTAGRNICIIIVLFPLVRDKEILVNIPLIKVTPVFFVTKKIQHEAIVCLAERWNDLIRETDWQAKQEEQKLHFGQ